MTSYTPEHFAPKRLFTFGCSFTHFFWPTWADILGSTYDHYENWACSGYGNRAIVERLSECVAHNKITADDTIVIQFTDFHRHDIHQQGIEPHNISNWRLGGNIWVKEIEMEWVKDFWSESSYVYHSCNFINLGITLLKTLPCRYYITSMIDLRPDIERLHPGYSRLFNDDIEWKQDFVSFSQQENYQGIKHRQRTWDATIKKLVPKVGIDRHPTPKMYLKWLEQNLGFDHSNSFIEKIKQMPDDYIDTNPQEFYTNLDWHDAKYRIRGI
jgi:hypothetical protein